MNQYDEAALVEIAKWRNPRESRLARLTKPISDKVGQAADWAADSKIGSVALKAGAGAVSIVNDGAAWSVRPDAILAEYRKNGHGSVHRLADVKSLSLEDVERTVGYLSAKYKTLAAAEGAGAGSLGLPGLPIDITALIALALRATNEYATYYGYDVALETERYVALTVLGAASSTEVAAKQLAMNEVAKAAAMAGKKKTWEELQRLGLVRVIRKLAEQLGIRLTKAKLAQVVPIVGGVVGGGFNAWYLHTVCYSAQMVYRERFLREAYGEGVVPYR